MCIVIDRGRLVRPLCYDLLMMIGGRDMRQIEPRDTESLIPYANNARTHSVEQVARAVCEQWLGVIYDN